MRVILERIVVSNKHMRHRVICGLIAACLILITVVWLYKKEITYQDYSVPQSVYEEMYWSCIESGADSALTMVAGFSSPYIYLPAFLDLNKDTTIKDMGFNPYIEDLPVDYDMYKMNFIIPSIENLYIPQETFDGSYGNWKIQDFPISVEDSYVEITGINIKLVTLCTAYWRTPARDRCLDIQVDVFYDSGSVEEGELVRGYIFCYDFESKAIHRKTRYTSELDKTLLQIAKQVAMNDFPNEFISQNSASNFSSNDLGDVRYAENEEHIEYTCACFGECILRH
jgi:hypothetical protein